MFQDQEPPNSVFTVQMLNITKNFDLIQIFFQNILYT